MFVFNTQSKDNKCKNQQVVLPQIKKFVVSKRNNGQNEEAAYINRRKFLQTYILEIVNTQNI